MKQIVIHTPGDVRVEEAERPVLSEGHAILKLLYGGICGSDLGTYRGTFLYADYPRIPGHEFSAEIVEIGPNDRGLVPGMVVTANPYFNCGHCYSCQRGFRNCCTSNQTMGAQRDGAFREYITMPIDRIYDGRGLDPISLALIEPFCISYHAAKRVEIKPGDRVLVIGAGTIGHLAAAAARMLGGEVWMTDISAHKLEMARPMGLAGSFLNGEDFQERVDAITGGRGFDVCIEAVGLPSTFQNAVDAAAFRGRVAVVGIGKQSLDFFYSVIQTKELDIRGSRNALPEDFLELIERVGRGEFDVKSIVSAVYALEEAPRAFQDFAENGANLLKVLIRFC